MKAFKEWYNKEDYVFAEPQEIAKAAWKAALWWAMKTAMSHYGNDFMTNMPMNKLYKSIKEELKD